MVSVAVDKGEKTSNVSKGFWIDILNGGDPHRLQTVIFNIGVGGFFIYEVFHNINTATILTDNVIPVIPDSVLGMMGRKRRIYIGCKTYEK